MVICDRFNNIQNLIRHEKKLNDVAVCNVWNIREYSFELVKSLAR